MSKDIAILKALGQLAHSKNQRVDPEALAHYAQRLDAYPLEAIQGATLALEFAAGDFFPSLHQIVAEMARWLRGCVAPNGRAPVLAPDEAWHVARLTLSRYQPQSRPRPLSGNPAIDGALRQLGGVAACQWADPVGEGIVRRQFLAEYERQVASPEHVTWALSPAATAPPLIPGIEIPDHELARLAAEAEREGRASALADLLAAPRRAAVPDGVPRPDPLALPARADDPPPTGDEVAARRAAIRDGIARIAARTALPKPVAVPPLNEGDPIPAVPVAAIGPDVAHAAREAGDRRRDQLADRRERYGD